MILTIRYEINTNRVIQTYQGTGPSWESEIQEGTKATTTTTTKQERREVLQSAIDSFSGDYDPDTESVVAKLCYNPDTDEIYAESEIQSIES